MEKMIVVCVPVPYLPTEDTVHIPLPSERVRIWNQSTKSIEELDFEPDLNDVEKEWLLKFNNHQD
jgi:hypothetical protein